MTQLVRGRTSAVERRGHRHCVPGIDQTLHAPLRLVRQLRPQPDSISGSFETIQQSIHDVLPCRRGRPCLQAGFGEYAKQYSAQTTGEGLVK